MEVREERSEEAMSRTSIEESGSSGELFHSLLHSVSQEVIFHRLPRLFNFLRVVSKL